MAYYSGFQSNAFQRNAFQIKGSQGSPSPEVSGFGYPMPWFEHQEREYQKEKIRKRQLELKRVEDELAETEQKRIEAQEAQEKAKKKAAKKLAALEAMLQEEISRLRTERIWLMHQIDIEESILVLLLAAKRRFRTVLN